MMNHDLALTGLAERHARFFTEQNPMEKPFEFPEFSSQEMLEAEQRETVTKLSEFFDMDFGSMDDVANTIGEAIMQDAEVQAKVNDHIKVEELTARTPEENLQRYHEAQHMFKRRMAKKDGLTEPDISRSTEYVLSQQTPEYAERMGFTSQKKLQAQEDNRILNTLKSNVGNKRSYGGNSPSANVNTGFGTRKTTQTGRSGYGGNATNVTQQAPVGTGQEGENVSSQIFAEINDGAQHLSRQKFRAWSEVDEKESAFEAYSHNLPFWKKGMRKVKKFFKSGKGRIMIKVSALLALNMAMAVFSKRYEFQNNKEMFAMFGFAITSFFISRELTEEGIDLGNFGY